MVAADWPAQTEPIGIQRQRYDTNDTDGEAATNIVSTITCPIRFCCLLDASFVELWEDDDTE